jgi:endonuclease VIII
MARRPRDHYRSYRVPGLDAARLVGAAISTVESQGKHLLIRFSTGDTLHTHLRMTGSWHVYSVRARWRLPESQARLELRAGDRVAVWFNAPVIELLASRAERMHPGLVGLGQDLLGQDSLDLSAARDRARRRAERSPTIGDLLLDQRVVAGIGNIYRCESLFRCGIDPWTPVGALSDAELDSLFATAAELLQANALWAGTSPFGSRPEPPS